MTKKNRNIWGYYAAGTVALLFLGFGIDQLRQEDEGLLLGSSSPSLVKSAVSAAIGSQNASENHTPASLEPAAKSAPQQDLKYAPKTTSAEGQLSSAQIVVGPFDIHRKYRSMEGPYVDQTFTIGDLLESKSVTLPEPMVRWVEKGDTASMMAGPDTAEKASSDSEAAPVGLKYADITKRDLYWLKSIKLQVLDENNKLMPGAEFICHMNLDVDTAVREKAFRNAEKVSNTRLITLTQGQTEVRFPDGYGVPVASFEPFRFTFQAANRTSNAHRRVKQLCTLEFIKDSDLKRPLTALSWYAPYIAVNIDKTPDALKPEHEMHGPSCLGNSAGMTAPNFVNGSVIKNNGGEHLVGHWAIPTGTHNYSSPITDERDLGFNRKDRVVHYVWSHLHPLCTETSLNVCDGSKKTPLWTVHAQTDTSRGLEIKHIEDVISEKGIVLPKDKHFELAATYKNTSGQPQDSMVVQGIFYEDDLFRKPDFSAEMAQMAAKATEAKQHECNGLFCGIKPTTKQQAGNDYGGSEIYPLYSADNDGSPLKSAQHVKLKTSSGNLNLTLDPAMAPVTATQIYKLFQAGAYGGTTICNYSPGYFLQIGAAYQKRNADYRLPAETSSLLRRLPLEVDQGGAGKGKMNGEQLAHRKWALDMTRNKAKDSGVSSFSVMLSDEPHLDHDYTVFGFVDQDPESMATIKKICDGWNAAHLPYIESVSGSRSGTNSNVSLKTNAKTSDSTKANANTKTKIGANTQWTADAAPEAINLSSSSGLSATALKEKTVSSAFVQPESTQPKNEASKDHKYLVAPVAQRTSNEPEKLPAFDPKTDGPLLKTAQRMILETSVGKIHILIEPELAPQNATQMCSLFKAGMFDGTNIVRYEPNFVLQTAVAENKIGATKNDAKLKTMLRRLPLEVVCQENGKGLHQKWALSMAHLDSDPNSATSSFSILLGDAPHLDHKYTVFGHVIPNAESKATIAKITNDWQVKHPHVVSAKPESNNSVAWQVR
ncbi:MAG TPA: peptidylprolyl isomerase [Oculatellaceae cyanobacterium]